MIVAKKLMIPFQVIDFSKEYKKRIVDYMFSEYKVGRTPNPDILCNKEIKFDLFLKKALEFNADYIATGHYASVRKKGNVFELISGLDKKKDQSYFLCQLNQNQLSKIIFPLGNLHKAAVREIAKKNNLVTADKKDSQGLCFIGKVKLPIFLQQKLKKKSGKIILVPKTLSIYSRNKKINDLDELSNGYVYSENDGEVVGAHVGAHFYTIGQRKGISVGGTKDPLYVIALDTIKNIIYVGEGDNHPGLLRKVLSVKKSQFHNIDDGYDITKFHGLKARIRYRQALQSVQIKRKKSKYFLIFDEYQKAITSGQFVAVYKDDVLLASGVIS